MSALDCIAAAIAWALWLQALELWLARDLLARRFPWSIVRLELAPAIARALDPVLHDGAWPWLAWLQVGCALAAAMYPAVWLAGCTFVIGLVLAQRFRGSFNGGSDAMTSTVLLGLLIARASPRVGLGYIAAQLTLSYFMAGVGKLRAPSWRDGSALAKLATTPQYAVPAGFQRLMTRGSRLAGYALITFECGFPLALLDSTLARVMLTLGALFHLLNVYALGLNRFFWAWLAAYPALWFWTQP